jgi:hypothetical protein
MGRYLGIANESSTPKFPQLIPSVSKVTLLRPKKPMTPKPVAMNSRVRDAISEKSVIIIDAELEKYPKFHNTRRSKK